MHLGKSLAATPWNPEDPNEPNKVSWAETHIILHGTELKYSYFLSQTCPQNLPSLSKETHIKRLAGLGHKGRAFQRYCFCQRNKQRGLEGQTTGEKTAIFFFIHTNLLSFWKKMRYALKSCKDFTHFLYEKNWNFMQNKIKGKEGERILRILKNHLLQC